MLWTLFLPTQISITEEHLLREYGLTESVSINRLINRPGPYVMQQESSYDRASQTPGNPQWFANGDAGKYLRTESTHGRNERVMMDHTGPGAIISIWSANPAGTLRFYFDGEATPRLQVATADLLSGKVAQFPAPFSYVSARGWNLYYPITFGRSLKVTAEGAGTEHMYYHIGYRAYSGQGEPIVSFQARATPNPVALEIAKSLIQQTPTIVARPAALAPGSRRTFFEQSSPGMIRRLSFRPDFLGTDTKQPWNHPGKKHNVLRSLRLIAWFDGEKCVDVPLGDFFGSGVGINPFRSIPMNVEADGTMCCWFPMPFSSSARIEVRNDGSEPVALACDVSSTESKEQGINHFKAQWISYFGDSQPQRDMEMLHAKGQGWLVGSALYIENSRPEWWGEGDEKISVDGEEFPSFFGTGTEDFYCYAWCWPEVFSTPFNAQPRVDGPGNFGHTSVNRWLIADAIPFQKSLQFDMELWHWAQCKVKFSRVAYWYEQPGGTEIAEVDSTLLPPAELVPSPPIKGAIEGEGLSFLKPSGGRVETQGGFWELSSGKQLWWTHMKTGDTLVLEVPVPRPGTYKLTGNFCRAKDYGIHRIEVGGVSKIVDFYSDKLLWEKMSIGDVKAFGKTLRIVVQSLGSRKGTVPGNMFGLDYLLLEPK